MKFFTNFSKLIGALCLLFAFQSFNTPTPATTIAKEDFIFVVRNNTLIFDVLDEESIDNQSADIGIVNQPTFGTVALNPDKTFSFFPDNDVCEEVDEFSYYIIKEDRIDTINVFVEILCEKLTFVNGFAPTGTEPYQTFTILGVQNFPNNKLIVFNKWGEEVYFAESYADGLPIEAEDNIFYYVFEDGIGGTYSGYMNIE